MWRHIRDLVRAEFPDRPEMHLPPIPMRRHHFLYARDRDLTQTAILQRLSERARLLAVAEARRQGMRRQHVDLLGYALLVNGMSRLRHERSPAAEAA